MPVQHIIEQKQTTSVTKIPLGATNSQNISPGISLRVSLKNHPKDKNIYIQDTKVYIEDTELYILNIINFLLLKTCSTTNKTVVPLTTTSTTCLYYFYNQKETLVYFQIRTYRSLGMESLFGASMHRVVDKEVSKNWGAYHNPMYCYERECGVSKTNYIVCRARCKLKMWIPLFKNSLQISRWQQKSIKPSMEPF